jgi:hypothetical protein
MKELEIRAPSEEEVEQERQKLQRIAEENPSFQSAVRKLARVTFSKKPSGKTTLPPGSEPVQERNTAPKLDAPLAPGGRAPIQETAPVPERVTRAEWRILLIGGAALLVLFTVFGVIVGILLSERDPKPQPEQPVTVITVTVPGTMPPTNTATTTAEPTPSATVTPTAIESASAAPSSTSTASAKPSVSPFERPIWNIP